MERLHFTYEMDIEYSTPVGRCNYTIKCIPENTKRQKIEGVTVSLFPDTKYSYGRDGLGNLQLYGVNEEEHKLFKFWIEGYATVGLDDHEDEYNDNLDMVFKHPHGLNTAGDKIKEYYEQLKLDGIIVNGEEAREDKSVKEISPLEQAIQVMHSLHQDFAYEACITDVNTSAEEAFAQGKGVCQDYAHIFISLMHLTGIAARYVTGLIVGEGASHAWVEVLSDGKWYGLDPTNDSIVGEEHIKIGIGRDAKDCCINRGIMHGGGLHTQTIRVNVTK